MRKFIYNDIWKRSGISIIWDLTILKDCNINNEIITINKLFNYSINGWPEELPGFNDNALIVSGLECIMDILSPDECNQWLEKRLYPLLLSFQKEYEGQAGLIFLLPSGRDRIKYLTVEDTFEWLCLSKNNNYIPFSSSLWNGAEKDAKYITITEQDMKGKLPGLGLYHPRIS